MSTPVLMQASYPIEVPDVSYFQNYTKPDPVKGSQRVGIDYARVRACRPSIRAVMVKASEGDWDGYLVSDFLEQAEGFARVGLPVIPYHYWHYEVTPTAQARRFSGVIKQASVKPKRAMVDIEDVDIDAARPPSRVLSVSEYPAWTRKAKLIMPKIRDSLDAISQALGFLPFWYGGEWWQGWCTWMASTTYDGTPAQDLSWIHKYGLHCASYTAPWMYLCTGFSMDQALFWQWTSTPQNANTTQIGAQIAGFPNPGSLDMNYWLKSEAEWNVWIGESESVPQTWEQSIDAWARTQGYVGPKPV